MKIVSDLPEKTISWSLLQHGTGCRIAAGRPVLQMQFCSQDV